MRSSFSFLKNRFPRFYPVRRKKDIDPTLAVFLIHALPGRMSFSDRSIGKSCSHQQEESAVVKFASWGWIEIVAGALRRQEARGERSCAILFMNERTVLQLHGQQRQKKRGVCIYGTRYASERRGRRGREREGMKTRSYADGERETGMKADGTMGMG